LLLSDAAVEEYAVRNCFHDYEEKYVRAEARAYAAIARELARAGGARVWRRIRIPADVDPVKFIRWDCVGRAWTLDESCAEVFNPYPHGSAPRTDVVLEGWVTPDSVDWMTGICKVVMVGATEEAELPLNAYASISIRSMTVKVGEDAHRMTFRPAIEANAGPAHDGWARGCEPGLPSRARSNPSRRSGHVSRPRPRGKKSR
jgi:hypothetical protein